jgi:hypothetical protein
MKTSQGALNDPAIIKNSSRFHTGTSISSDDRSGA